MRPAPGRAWPGFPESWGIPWSPLQMEEDVAGWTGGVVAGSRGDRRLGAAEVSGWVVGGTLAEGHELSDCCRERGPVFEQVERVGAGSPGANLPRRC